MRLFTPKTLEFEGKSFEFERTSFGLKSSSHINEKTERRKK